MRITAHKKRSGRKENGTGIEMDQVMHKAEVLIEALPYIQRFNRKIIVVKYGGSAMMERGTAEKRHSGCHPA